MHINRLPKEMLEILEKGPRDAAFLKKVQRVYCDRVTYEELCPLVCWRCNTNLVKIATQYRERGVDDIGMWHVTVQNFTLSLIETVRESTTPDMVLSNQRFEVDKSDLIKRFMEQ